MERATISDAALCCFIVLGALVAMFGGMAWRAWPPQDPVALLSAIATLGATLVALGFGVRDSRRRKADEIALAELAAASVAVRVEHLQAAVRHCVAMYEFRNSPGFTFELAHQIHDELKSTVEWIPSSSIQALVPLPSRCAHRIARAVSLVDWVTTELERLPAWTPYSHTHNVPEMAWSRWVSHLEEARQLLSVSAAECRRAASVAAPVPSLNEQFA